jgi:hypothetical protein
MRSKKSKRCTDNKAARKRCACSEKKSGSPCGEPNRTNNHGVPVKGQAHRAIAVPLDEDECATGIALAR